LEWVLNDADMHTKGCYIDGLVFKMDNGAWIADAIFIMDFDYLVSNNEDEIVEKYFCVETNMFMLITYNDIRIKENERR